MVAVPDSQELIQTDEIAKYGRSYLTKQTVKKFIQLMETEAQRKANYYSVKRFLKFLTLATQRKYNNAQRKAKYYSVKRFITLMTNAAEMKYKLYQQKLKR